jgi:hypothetical protein
MPNSWLDILAWPMYPGSLIASAIIPNVLCVGK